VLSGKVSREYERDLAERSAAEAPGVVEVTNLIKVEH
jgi:osmotically-inducible protein OsmY